MKKKSSWVFNKQVAFKSMKVRYKFYAYELSFTAIELTNFAII